MHIEEKIKIEADKLEEFFYRYYIKKYIRTKYIFHKKFHVYFVKAAEMFSVRTDYDAFKLVQSFFIDGFKYPTQFPKEQTWKTYLSYYSGLLSEEDKNNELKRAVIQVLSGVEQIKKFGSIDNCLKNVLVKDAIFRNRQKFSLKLFFFSKSFYNFYKENYDKFDRKYNFTVMRFNLISNKEVLDKIKKVLKDDYIL